MKLFVVIIIFAIALAAVGFSIYKDFTATNMTEVALLSEKESAVDRQEQEKSQNTAANNNSQTAEKAGIDSEKIRFKMPDLSKPIEIKTELPEDIKKQTTEEIQALSNSLKKDYDSLEQWIQLGLLRKLFGDYEGAKEVWEFAALIRPKNHVPFHNLGFLYWQYLKDFSLSEKNYLKAIENNPQDMGAYVDLSNVYFFNLKDRKKAENILLRGLQKNINNPELLSALADLKNR